LILVPLTSVGTLYDWKKKEQTELYVDWRGSSLSAKECETLPHIHAHSHARTHPQRDMLYDFQNLSDLTQ